jgi:SAM-dependent methyltransferase
LIVIGTGTEGSTTASELSERGFTVTASDISKTAIKQASINRNKDAGKINFVMDNILNSGFKESEFDFIFDRGCFHVISANDRVRYVYEVNRILKDGGLLFLKCFSERTNARSRIIQVIS